MIAFLFGLTARLRGLMPAHANDNEQARRVIGDFMRHLAAHLNERKLQNPCPAAPPSVKTV